MSMRDHIIKWAREREPVSINELAEHVQILFDKQARAASAGMDAAKKGGAYMEAEAKRLYAQTNPEALESERQANAELTEELERVTTQRDAAQAKLDAIGQLSPTDYDDREQLLGALFRILHGMETDKEPTE
ncbi:hypothetical protein [Halomonas lysinitropha]|uniref:Uncharacterized protein n=1 Tax=Halomonas lysinitropha TaxID=2607506 RepID=A0A5K1I4S2_9GAMM|nr:hypothetical protein [Halomonas lysinitropha]VVZ96455.1 hypothetical protein HALO32_02555 [Halomonas lysinitropha]